jgi:AcrR family transcriptional regulator
MTRWDRGRPEHRRTRRAAPPTIAAIDQRASGATRSYEGNRGRLLDLAATVFATEGFAAVSVRDLAARLGVTTGAIYSSFRSKGDLLAEVLDVRIRQDLERASESVALPEYVRQSFVRMPERAQMRALMLEAGVAARTDPGLRDRLLPPNEARLNGWIASYRDWQRSSGVDRAIDMATLVAVLWAIELGIGVLEAYDAVGAKPAAVGQAIGQAIGIFLGSLERGGGTSLAPAKRARPSPTSRSLPPGMEGTAPVSRRRLSAKAQATQARLVEAATELFADRGYAAVSVRDLAWKTGLTTGSIYGNFAGKGNLLVEAIEARITEDLERMPADLVRTGSPADLVAFHMKDFRKRAPLRALMLEGAAAARSEPDVRDRLRDTQTRHLQFWAAGLDQWLAAQRLNPAIEMRTLVTVIWSTELGLGLLEALGWSPPSPRAVAKLFRRLLEALGVEHPAGLANLEREGRGR